MADADMAAAAAATEQVAIGVVKLSKPVEEHTMEFDGFKCPDQMVNDFTPLEFEDLVVLFKKYDVDGSGGDSATGLDAIRKDEPPADGSPSSSRSKRQKTSGESFSFNFF